MKQRLILLTVLLTALSAFSQTANLRWSTNVNSTITITGYIGTPTSLTIPDSINGLSVTSIGYMAFRFCASLTSVTIPDSVTSIGDYAFAFCTSLTNVALGNSVTSIGGYAFAGCTSLAGVTIPDSVTSIGESALNGCTGLTSVMIGSGVSSIGDSALNGCSSLISITVNSTNSFYSGMAGVLFDKSQATLIRYPGGGAGSYSIPSSVTSIGDRAFGAAGRLTSVTIPGSVTSIKGAAFNGCSGLTSVTIPNSVTNIGSAAFAWCTSLSSVTIPDSITSIGFGLFYSCANLSSVTIPYSITSIGDQAFTDCTGLMGVYFQGNAPSLGGTLVFSGDTSATIYRLSGATGWPTVPNLWAGRPTALYSAGVCYTLTVNSGSGGGSYTNGQLVAISADAPASGKVFDQWTGATQYVANASSASTTVTMPTQAIAVTATYKDITTALGDYIYTTNSGTITITRYAGTNTTVIIPGTIEGLPVTSIGYGTFYEPISHNSAGAFWNCTNLTSVTIPNSLTNIGERAFEGCVSLTNVMIGNGVTRIDYMAFSACTSLTSVTIPDSVTSMRGHVFAFCSSLTSVIIGSGVTSSLSVFYECYGLTEVYFKGNAPSVPQNFFNGAGNATVYRLSGATGWPTVPSLWPTDTGPWAGRPTALWDSGYYLLTVNSGSGSGSYTNGQQVTISADAPASGKIFDQWTGDTQVVNNVTYTNAIVTMSTNPVTLTATYVDIYYTLTVNGGSGSGTYTNGQQVAISTYPKDFPPYDFFAWTGDTQYVANVRSSSTTITMPAANITVTATYTDIYLTVNSGTGSGSCTNGQQVAISANAPASGKVFDRWTGATQYVANASSASTTVTMPAQAIAVTATYKDITYTLTVNHGSGDGAYTNGQQVAIEADSLVYIQIWPPVPQMTFDAWTGDIQYVANIHSSTTTVTMPPTNITVTATYKEVTNSPPVEGLTVISGTVVSVSYSNVVIVANAPAAGKTFDRWIGDVQYVANIYAPITTVVLPPWDIILIATYKDITYTLTVNGGPDSGVYTNGTVVLICADDPGYVFDHWIGDTAHLADSNAACTTLIMPAHDITLTPTYKNIYTLTGQGNTGGSVSPTSTNVPIGDSATFTITASNLYRIATLTTNGTAVTGVTFSNSSTSCIYIWSNVQYSGTLAATFMPQIEIPPPPLVDLGLDSDGDGLKDWEESIAGTDPSNAVSCFKTVVQNTPNKVSWSPVVSGRVYSVYWSTNLVKGFTNLAGNILYPTNNYTNATPASKMNYYQIKVRMQ